jgi:predicted secreted protein
MALPGKKARVMLGTDAVLGINESTFTINGEVVDVTTFESGGWRERIQNLRDASISISGFYDPDDSAGQMVIQNAVLTQAVVEDVRVLATTDPADIGFECDVIVESFEINPSVEGAVPVSISMESTGVISVIG